MQALRFTGSSRLCLNKHLHPYSALPFHTREPPRKVSTLPTPAPKNFSPHFPGLLQGLLLHSTVQDHASVCCETTGIVIAVARVTTWRAIEPPSIIAEMTRALASVTVMMMATFVVQLQRDSGVMIEWRCCIDEVCEAQRNEDEALLLRVVVPWCHVLSAKAAGKSRKSVRLSLFTGIMWRRTWFCRIVGNPELRVISRALSHL